MCFGSTSPVVSKKAPRELTWVTGVVMAVITVTFGVYRLLPALGPGRILGRKDCFWCTRSDSRCWVNCLVETHAGWSGGWSAYADSLLQLAYLCVALVFGGVYAAAFL